ncbi:hypothetical protein FRB94_003942 [Tulasnella sp. JGI-2019a]|nr:hypothetical protein FRB94_003942 [Tulasnella sp. JGI-2019a]KAG9008195.1 hypothetical protein FRB93_006763 [Tulasnella sp. JGI-2019a]
MSPPIPSSEHVSYSSPPMVMETIYLDLKRRKRKKNKKSHEKTVALTDVTPAESITPPWTVFPLDIIHEVGALLEISSKPLKPLIVMLGFRYFNGYILSIFFNLQGLLERYTITS